MPRGVFVFFSASPFVSFFFYDDNLKSRWWISESIELESGSDTNVFDDFDLYVVFDASFIIHFKIWIPEFYAKLRPTTGMLKV